MSNSIAYTTQYTPNVYPKQKRLDVAELDVVEVDTSDKSAMDDELAELQTGNADGGASDTQMRQVE